MVVKDLTAIWEWIYILGEQSLWRIINDKLKNKRDVQEPERRGYWQDQIKDPYSTLWGKHMSFIQGY